MPPPCSRWKLVHLQELVIVFITIIVVAVIIIVLIVVVMTIASREKSSKEPIAFVVRSGGKEQSVGAASHRAIAECKGPETIDDDRSTLTRSEQALELAFGVKGHDCAATEVADQEIAAVSAKRVGCKSNAPG